jgi:putative Holliday junction resolvase
MQSYLIFAGMGKILGIDFGLKRIGLAITDDSKIIASPFRTIENKHWSLDFKAIVEKENIELFVLGLPKSLDNREIEMSYHVDGFKMDLSLTFPNVPIVLVDERFTSKMASQAILHSGVSKKRRQDKSVTDRVSAAIILQSYLSSLDISKKS